MQRTKIKPTELIANLGDAHPVEYGGCFVFRNSERQDMVEVYNPEEDTFCMFPIDRLEIVYVSNSAAVRKTLLSAMNAVQRGEISLAELKKSLGDIDSEERIALVPRGLLDDTDKKDHEVWFSKEIPNVSKCCDLPENELYDMFASADIVRRAEAYRCVGEYFGYEIALNCELVPVEEWHNDAFERYCELGWIDENGKSTK